jgi:release factor glutamine methyltransferase
MSVFELAQKNVKEGSVEIVAPNDVKIVVKRGVFVPDYETLLFTRECIGIIRPMGTAIERIADVGTGSGVIAVTLGKAFPEKTVYGYDISKRALDVARLNARNNGTRNVTFYRNANRHIWISPETPTRIDIVISNPPYVGNEEIRSPCFMKDFPDFNIQPKSGMRSYDRTGLLPYISTLKAAKEFGAKYILFRCNTGNVDAIASVLTRAGGVKTEALRTESKELVIMRVTLLRTE